MAYKRPNIEKPKKPHPIQDDFGHYEQINTAHDPGWIHPHLTELMDDGRYALSQFFNIVEEARRRDLSEYKPEIAAAKKKEPVLGAKRALMSFLKKHVGKAKSDIEQMKAAILRITQPDSPSDPTRAMLAELKNQEIRNIVRNTDPKNRHDLVKGNIDFIKAMVGAPDNIINKENLTQIRREYAFAQDPSLELQERDQKEIYQAVRKRAAEISATASKMLILAKIDDPLPPGEFYELFTPETDYDKVLIQKRIENYDRAQMKIERDKQFAEQNEGINLEIEGRRSRHRQ